MTLMFQKRRSPSVSLPLRVRTAYGRLGVLAGWLTLAKILFDVPPQAFWPPPKVTSERRPARAARRTAPGGREKGSSASPMACLRPAPQDAAPEPEAARREALLERVGIEPTRRAETLSVAEFCALAEAL
jgi:16S rRNA (adenine1518-N6/adenine1519-N6)-dimethyltransferase